MSFVVFRRKTDLSLPQARQIIAGALAGIQAAGLTPGLDAADG